MVTFPEVSVGGATIFPVTITAESQWVSIIVFLRDLANAIVSLAKK